MYSYMDEVIMYCRLTELIYAVLCKSVTPAEQSSNKVSPEKVSSAGDGTAGDVWIN